MSLELLGQGWNYYNSLEASPPNIPTEDGPDQSIQDHLVQSGQGWVFHIDAETNQWVRMFGERFIELDERHEVKQVSRSETPYGSHKKSIELKVRKRA